MADYEDYLYTDHPYPETHVDRLAALCTLHGLRPARPDRCRVLELGCGLGGNLIGMAELYPQSTFHGIDRSRKQVAAGRRTTRALGLENITLRAQDILDFPPGEQVFDYVICHGVYSWVSEEVQGRILDIARQHLAPQGVAYVSFNTYPGWHLRGALRDMLRRHVGPDGAPEERIARARALLHDLRALSSERGAAQGYLESEVRLLGAMDDAYLLYEHLVDRNQPCYFADFAAAAARAGLQYLTDAETCRSFPGHLGEEVEAACQGLPNTSDVIAREARLDLLDARFFRRALLCRAEVAVDRELTPARLRPLYISSRLKPMSDKPAVQEAALHFECEGQRRGVSAHHPLLQAALLLLHEHRPRGLPFPALCAMAYEQVHGKRPRRLPQAAQHTLGKDLFELLALSYLDLGLGTPAYVTRPGPRPRTTALCRLQARRGAPGCTSLLHQSVEVDDLDRLLLARLDGETGVRDLCTAVAALVKRGALTLLYEDEPVEDAALLRRIIRQRLGRLARSGFLLA